MIPIRRGGRLAPYPEFNDALAANCPADHVLQEVLPIPSASPSPNVDFLNRDYELDIGGCVSRGWGIFKNNFGVLFVSFLLVALIVIVVGALLNAIGVAILPKNLVNVEAYRQALNFVVVGLTAIVAGPLIGGLYHVFIRCAGRKVPVNVGDVFIGFNRNFKHLFLGQLVLSFVTSLCMLPYNIVNDAKVMPLLDQDA